MDSTASLLSCSATSAAEGAADHCTLPVSHPISGGWVSARFIIGAEMAERLAFYGVSSNLITYLTAALGYSTASAATNVNAWAGASMMLTVLGAVVADLWLGPYWTIVGSSLLYIMGLGMLSFSAELPSFGLPKCSEGSSCHPTKFQGGLFFAAIYLIAFAQGGHKPCMQAFGADQFDENDPGERQSKSSFFNWWLFGSCCSAVLTIMVLNYIQENISWAIGFEIPFVTMVLALIIFLLGTKTYQYYMKPCTSRVTIIENAVERLVGNVKKQFKTSDGVAFISVNDELVEQNFSMEHSKLFGTSLCSSLIRRTGLEHELHKREDLEDVLLLFPIWLTCLIYAIIFAQPSTFFTKQGSTMDRRIGKLLMPPAALQSFISIAIIGCIPIYDLFLIPVARKFTGVPTGITTLQRIGIGIFLSIISMVVAALVELKRLQTAKDLQLTDFPSVVIPMSLWWLVPQYVMSGVTEVFINVGLQEFFYDQVPEGLRSLGLALYMCMFGLGSFISSFLVSMIDKYSSKNGDSWFCNNLNRGHLDYFYWFLAGLGALQLVIFLYLSQSYQYKKKRSSILCR